MPVHDWTRVDAGMFHHFHLTWIAALSNTLNGGLLPSGYYALAEQHAGASIPDVLTLHFAPSPNGIPPPTGGVAAISKTRPRAQVKLEAKRSPKGKRRTIAIRHVSGHRIVALLEVVSPANKDRRRSVTDFVNKLVTAIQFGIHILLIDLHPPGPHDPAGMHAAVWDRFDPDRPSTLPAKQPITLAAYAAGKPAKAFVDFLGVGDSLPKKPLFLTAKRYIDVPLERSYTTAYQGLPEFWREVVEGQRSADASF